MAERLYPPCHHREFKTGCFACDKWANDPHYKATWSREPSNTVTIIPPPTEGPGTELAKLLGSLGFKTDQSCGCEEVKNWMNRLGVDGCRRERQRIIDHLGGEWGKTAFGKKLVAAFKAAVSGVPLTIPGLVDEAIRRAALLGFAPAPVSAPASRQFAPTVASPPQ
jgi:hypothetical protein